MSKRKVKMPDEAFAVMRRYDCLKGIPSGVWDAIWTELSAIEREACANVCEAKGEAIMEKNRMVSAYVMAGECAAAILERSNAKFTGQPLADGPVEC